MSTYVPALEAWVPESDSPASLDGLELPPYAALPAFVPRQSRLVSWPVRVAQMAERVVARALPEHHVPGASGRGLTEITLAGLDHVCRLIPYHQHVVAAERARLRIRQAIERRAERYRRFLELRRALVDRPLSLGADDASQLHLNPAHCWIRWTTECPPGEAGTLAGSVLFFLDGNDLRGIRMCLEGQVLINELADYEPCTVAQWAQLSALVDGLQLAALVRHLVRIGLVAHT